MLRKEDKKEIKKILGAIDGPKLITVFNRLGIGSTLQFCENDKVSIPKYITDDIAALQIELTNLSAVGRTFELTEENDRLVIDLVKVRSDYKKIVYPTFLFKGNFDKEKDEFFQKEIKKILGAIDGPKLITVFNRLGVGSTLQFCENNNVSIPKYVIDDIAALQIGSLHN